MSIILIPVAIALFTSLIIGLYLVYRLLKLSPAKGKILFNLVLAVLLWLVLFFVIPFAFQRGNSITWQFTFYLFLCSGGVLTFAGLGCLRSFKRSDALDTLLIGASLFLSAGLLPLCFGYLGNFLMRLWNIHLQVG